MDEDEQNCWQPWLNAKAIGKHHVSNRLVSDASCWRMDFHALKLFMSDLQRGKLNKTIEMPGLMRHRWEMQHSSSTVIPSNGRWTTEPRGLSQSHKRDTLTCFQKDCAEKMLCSILNVISPLCAEAPAWRLWKRQDSLESAFMPPDGQGFRSSCHSW